jgi:rhodanese-related sulfurtransferase
MQKNTKKFCKFMKNSYLCIELNKKMLMKKLILSVICSFLSICAFAEIQSVPPDVFYDMLMAVDSNDRQLIDIRTRHEFEEHRIADAINIDIRTAGFREKIELLDKNKPVFIYCLRSVRTQQAMQIFQELGFENVIELKGGMIAWLLADKPIQSDPN